MFAESLSEDAGMRVSECIRCKGFPCRDVRPHSILVPEIEMKPEHVQMVMISEAAPEHASDYFYAEGNPLFEQTTVQAFQDAGVEVGSMKDVVARGVYLTTAIKCAKKEYTIRAETVQHCSFLLERELVLFPNVRVLMLMGDVAIKGLNYIAERVEKKRAVPAGSTYRLRGHKYTFKGMRVFPSYLQAGPSFFIEKSKRKMIAEDIAAGIKAMRGAH